MRRGGIGAAPLIALVLMLLPSVGCIAKPEPVSGTIAFEDGSPVTSGRIEFRSSTDGSRFVSRIDPDGHFTPVDDQGRPGLRSGQYEVVVVQLVLTEDLAAEQHDHGHTVPRRYADYYSSPLRVEVTDRTSEIDISLSMD